MPSIGHFTIIHVNRHVLCDLLALVMIVHCVSALLNYIDKVALVMLLTLREIVQPHQTRSNKHNCSHCLSTTYHV
jgi:hypothetical protein